MSAKIFNYISSSFTLLLITISVLTGQEFRNKLLPGFVTFPHMDNTLNPYDYSGNYAWLAEDEKLDWLKISSGYLNISGNYKRTYDFGESNNYRLSFTGVKHLPEGTFLGFASYNFEHRNNVYRTLKYDTYAGEAFFTADTTTGSFNYKGPSVGFAYSFELLPNLYIGPSVNYGILSGLKDRYSRAKTLYRNVGVDLGLAYRFSNNLIFGITTGLEDIQEGIESKSDGLMPVEIYNFRGETHSIIDVGVIVTQKLKKQGLNIAPHFFFRPFQKIQIAAKGKFSNTETKVLIPRSNVLSDEDGSSDTRYVNLSTQVRYYHSELFSVGAYVDYGERESWSSIYQHNLTIWEWNIKHFKTGAGFSYLFYQIPLLFSGEIEYGYLKADSSKYIDHRISNVRSGNYLFRIAVEYNLSHGVYLCSGFQKGYNQLDLISAGRNLAASNFSFDISKSWQGFQTDLILTYDLNTPKSGGHRQKFAADFQIKYFTF